MNCVKCRELMTAYVEGLLDSQLERDVASHVETCSVCRAEAMEQRHLHERLLVNGRAFTATPVATAVMNRISNQQNSQARRIKMHKQYGKIGLGLAAAAVLAVLFIVPWGTTRQGQATAAEVLAQAIEAVSGLQSVYITLSTRTTARDNFEAIGLDDELVPHEMWKEFGEMPRWRVEKSGRVVVMDGTSSRLLIRSPNSDSGTMASQGTVDTNYVGWLLDLLDVEHVLQQQLRLAKQKGWDLQLTHEEGGQGVSQLVVTVEATAQGDFSNDWCRNKSISASDHRRVYRFDAETRRLDDLEVWIHGEQGNVLVLDIEKIVYNPKIAGNLFTLEIPEDAVWFEEPDVLPDNDKYAQMSPAEAARAFFQACADEDWDEALKFLAVSGADEHGKKHLGGLEIISIGEPFKSGQFPGWFVPYEVKYKSGRIQKHNLALRNDNEAGRYVVDGGI